MHPARPYPGLIKVFTRSEKIAMVYTIISHGQKRKISLTNLTYRVTDSTVDLNISHQVSRLEQRGATSTLE